MAWKTAVSILFVTWLTYFLLSIFRENEIELKELIKGKNVLITGASSGIGEEMAYTYAKNGANVFITARREELLQQVVSRCRSLGVTTAKFGYLSADMGKDDDRLAVIKAALKLFGELDHLILNHAYMPPVYWWTGSFQQLEHLKGILNVNVYANVHLTALALPSLKRRGGSIGVVGSMLGRISLPMVLEYSSSKFALDGFFSGLRHEFKATKQNVSVTFGVIGVIDTESGLGVMQRYLDALEAPSMNTVKFFQPAKVENAANAIIRGTAQRQGEVYFPKSQLLWVQQLLRSIYPQFAEVLDLGLDTDTP